jgi:KDO2-lipid IV(A) lauroyltransferase
MRLTKPIFIWGAWTFSKRLRHDTLSNARRLLGPDSSPKVRKKLALAVMGNCFDTVVEFGQNSSRTREEILSRLESVSGMERYDEIRRLHRGAILVTAHLGLFETAIITLMKREPRVHVVFQRDRFPVFEKLRAAQHARLGIIEAPVDEGIPTWMRLRDALLADDVVLMQGDRVMPGQSGVEAPFLGGRVRVPTGPVKLARITGAPVVPAFAIKTPEDRVRVFLEEPVIVEDHPPGESSIDPVVLHLTLVIERYVKEFPEQWLCLHPAWCDDEPPGVE